MRWTKLACVALITAMVGLASVGLTPARAQGRNETLLVVTESGPNSMDIHGVGANRPSYQASWNLYDRLLTYGVKTLPDGSKMYDYSVLKPELAESWQVAPDGTSVTFKLHRDAKFHDGTPVTAKDVKWSFDRAVTVGGFPTFQMKAGSLEKPEQFVVVDDVTFRINFLRKDRLTLPDIAVPVPVIINAELAKKHATASDPWAMEWLKNNDAGGGAFKPTRKPGQERVHPLRTGSRAAAQAQEDDRARGALGGQPARAPRARGLLDLPPKDFDEMAKAGKLKVVGIPVENAMSYVGMNVKTPPFDNVKVRQAVAYAIPYDKIMDAATYGRGIKLYGGGSVNPPTAAWPQPIPYKTDIAKAKALLAEAGQPNGFETTLSFDQGFSTVNEPTAVLIQESLQSIGIKAAINKVPGASWRGPAQGHR
jgi:peptide/nickel transport system substrate-binding protein